METTLTSVRELSDAEILQADDRDSIARDRAESAPNEAVRAQLQELAERADARQRADRRWFKLLGSQRYQQKLAAAIARDNELNGRILGLQIDLEHRIKAARKAAADQAANAAEKTLRAELAVQISALRKKL